MTEKQKKAIKVLNDLKLKSLINDNEYFMFLDFVVEQQQITYIPYYQEKATIPLSPTYKT